MREFIRQAIAEDVGDGDHTTLASIPLAASGQAQMIVKDEGIIAGVEVALLVFAEIDKTLQVQKYTEDGERVSRGDIVLIVKGSVHSILKAERLVLNIVQRMSGIATTTNKYVEEIKGFKSKVLDTRKTTPNFRYFEKKAVKIGGGENHRFGLYDMILIKDNHIDYAGGIEQAIRSVGDYLSATENNLKVEIEARSIADVQKILKAGGVHRIMLDNFTPGLTREAVTMIQRRYETEASGGITLENIKQYAQSGVDYISVGALTHSYKSLDISLKAETDKN